MPAYCHSLCFSSTPRSPSYLVGSRLVRTRAILVIALPASLRGILRNSHRRTHGYISHAPVGGYHCPDYALRLIARLRQPSTQCFQAALRSAATATVQLPAPLPYSSHDCGSRCISCTELLTQSALAELICSGPRYGASPRNRLRLFFPFTPTWQAMTA